MVVAVASCLVRSGVSIPCRRGDRFRVLLVLGALLVRLRWGVLLRLYSEILSLLVNRSLETETVNLLDVVSFRLFNYLVYCVDYSV